MNKKKYIFDQDSELSRDSLSEFLQDYEEGKLSPFFKTEPVPESNPGPVIVAVGSTFDSIVASANVFMEFYAPWCGHCKSLAPVYEELGAAVWDQYGDEVIIAKIDATANDTPESVTGFPTLIFYPFGGKPIKYSGARDLEAMKDFIAGNAILKKKTVQRDEL